MHQNLIFINLPSESFKCKIDFCFRSALQVSMSESMQTKPGELVPSSNLEPKSEMDQMFAGLGLGSYVSKKDTGAIATGLMSNNTSQVMSYNKL